MHNSETVSYVLKDYNFREVCKGQGVVEYHLVDEFGNNRDVTAKASTGWNKKITSVRPLVHRETPLVEALAKTKVNETITVDYSEFNKKYPRGSIRTKSMKVRKVKVDPNNSLPISDLGSIVSNKVRLAKLIGFTLAGFATVMYFVGA